VIALVAVFGIIGAVVMMKRKKGPAADTPRPQEQNPDMTTGTQGASSPAQPEQPPK